MENWGKGEDEATYGGAVGRHERNDSQSAVSHLLKSPIEDQLRKIESILNKDKS